MPWVGNKSMRALSGWIVSLLPPADDQQAYIEPFAGMLGVLLARGKVQREVVNDADLRVVNWWHCVRDEPDELARLIALTPASRHEYARSVGAPGCVPDLEAARQFTVLVMQDFAHSANGGGGFRPWRSPKERRDWRGGLDARLAGLADRLRDVVLEQLDGADLLDRWRNESHAVFYCDPPYPSAAKDMYAVRPDFGALTDVLVSLKGKVAISGYGCEWDHLGWVRNEMGITAAIAQSSGVASARTEVLWTNYEPEQRKMLL